MLLLRKPNGYLPRFAKRIGPLVAQIIDLPDRKDALVSFLKSEIRSVILAVGRIHICVESPYGELDRGFNCVGGLCAPLVPVGGPKKVKSFAPSENGF